MGKGHQLSAVSPQLVEFNDITALGRRAIITGLNLRERFVLPQLASNTP